MSEASDVADQLVKMSMEGAETAVKITGSAAKEVALLIASAIKEGVNQSGKTHGRERLGSMLKSGKELKVFAVRQKDLKEFTEHAKQYGILYCVLKDKNGKETGMTDIIARAEDASKIQRIFDKYGLGKVERSTVKAEPEKEPEGKEERGERTADGKTGEERNDDGKAEKENGKKPNPTRARAGKDRPSEPNSTTAATRGEKDGTKEERPSVKEKLDRYMAEAAKETAKEPKTKNKSKER